MRVLQVLGPSTGGIRRHVDALRTFLPAYGIESTVAGPAGVLDPLDHVVEVPTGLDPVSAFRARASVARAVDGHDLVHAHGLKAGWLASTVRERPPLVLSVHNLVLDEAAGRAAPLLRRLESALPGRADRTIAISREVAARFGGGPGSDRIVVIPPAGPVPSPSLEPAAVRRRLGIADDDDLVVTPARLHPQKDLRMLLDAAAIVRRERPRLRWFVFGDGPSRGELEAEITARSLTDVVTLAGRRPSVDDEIAAADVVAVTSRWESGPLVVLEALALRRPVVSTSVGLVPEVVAAPHGRVVAVGDAVAFAEAVVDVLASRGRTAPEPNADLAPERLVGRVADVYRELA